MFNTFRENLKQFLSSEKAHKPQGQLDGGKSYSDLMFTEPIKNQFSKRKVQLILPIFKFLILFLDQLFSPQIKQANKQNILKPNNKEIRKVI